MVKTASQMVPIGSPAPDFTLPDPSGKAWSLSDFSDSKALLVIFMCNHCPFVKHVREELVRLTNDFADKGLGIVAISSNDVESHPDDSPEAMAQEIIDAGYTFPYLYDESQEVAKAYHAACTPDFFLYDADLKLAYRGQLDDSRPGSGSPDGADLRAAISPVLNGNPAPEEQRASIGCNIKWKPGNAPSYFPAS